MTSILSALPCPVIFWICFALTTKKSSNILWPSPFPPFTPLLLQHRATTRLACPNYRVSNYFINEMSAAFKYVIFPLFHFCPHFWSFKVRFDYDFNLCHSCDLSIIKIIKHPLTITFFPLYTITQWSNG